MTQKTINSDETAGKAVPKAVSKQTDKRPWLIGLEPDELVAALAEMGLPAFRAKQIWHWLYHRGAIDFSQMTSLSRGVQADLAARFRIDRPAVTTAQLSSDGTRKWLVRFQDSREVESVFIPEEDRGALCVSSQVGCTLSCSFCHTGTQKLVRNLSAGEIVSQVLIARDALGEWPSPAGGRMLSNIVMMGMGEPLYNFDNVAKALRIVMHGEGISLSKRRITLSTSGIVPMIERCGHEIGVNLAISLHAVRDDLRNELVPINRKYPIAELLEACRNYPTGSNARRITFEYVMLKGVNDSDAEAHELVALLRGMPAKVNLIPFNAWPGVAYECSSGNRMRAFAKIINDSGFSAPLRVSRGRDIQAACGQLKSASERLRGERVALN